MANLKSSKKAIKTIERNRIRNQHYKTKLKSLIKIAKLSIENQEKDAFDKIKNAIQAIDKTASKGVIKKQTASRKKSRLMKAFNQLTSK